MMELTEAIRKRRSVRRYREEPVPEEVLRELLELACWAPSAENEQPWYFVALTSEEELRNLQTTMEQVAEKTKLHLEELLPKHPRIVGQTTEFLRRLGGAPVCILVFLQRDYGELRDSMLESTAAAIQTLLLAAKERDLGTCWINAATHLGYGPVLRELYAPDKGELVSIVTLGHPERTPIAAGRKPDRFVIR